MADETLRIGVAFAGDQLPGWQVQCLKDLLAVPGVSLAVVLQSPGPPPASAGPALWRWWMRLGKRSGTLQLHPSAPVLGNAPRAPWPAAGLGALARQHPLDAVLQFSGPPLAQGDALRFGIWRFVHGDEESTAPLPGVREVLQNKPVTRSTLVAAPFEAGRTQVLREGFFPVDPRSAHRTADAVLAHCAIWPAQVCRALLASGADLLPQAAEAPGPGPEALPGIGGLLRLIGKELAPAAERERRRSQDDGEWNIGVVWQPAGTLLQAGPGLHVRWLPPPALGRSRSSAFGWMRDAQLHVLYARSEQATGESVIARLRPKRDNNLKRSRTVLEGPEPLSYPFTWEHEGQVFAVPEQLGAGRVDLYRLDEEEAALLPVRTLLDRPLASPTLFRHAGNWWLFGTDPRMPDVLLLAFHAERLEGPYTPHLLNPLKMDVRSARPGGTPFLHEGRLWWPAQDRSKPDGQVILNQVRWLSPDRYEEGPGTVLPPLRGPWSHGVRTLSVCGDITLVDGRRAQHGKAKGSRQRSPMEQRQSH